MVTVAGQHDVVIDGFEVLNGPGALVSVTGSSNVELTRSFVVHNATGVTVKNDGAGVTIASDVIVKDWAVGTSWRITTCCRSTHSGATPAAFSRPGPRSQRRTLRPRTSTTTWCTRTRRATPKNACQRAG